MSCGGWKKWGCFCGRCKEAFQKDYGYELAPEKVINDYGSEEHQTLTKDFLQFRIRIMNEYLFGKYRRAINRARPGTPAFGSTTGGYDIQGLEPQSAVLHGLSGYGTEYPRGAGHRGYLNHPETFRPRQERIIRIKGDDIKGDGGQPRSLDVHVARVDCFADAQVLARGQAPDGSWWPVLVRAQRDEVRYCAFDPLAETAGDEQLAARLVQWVVK